MKMDGNYDCPGTHLRALGGPPNIPDEKGPNTCLGAYGPIPVHWKQIPGDGS